MYTSRSQPALNAKMSLIIIPLHHNTLAYYPGIPTEIARKDWRNWAYPVGVIFLVGELVETNTYRALNPVTFNLPLALDVLVEIIIALLMITFGMIIIIQQRQAHHQTTTS